MLTLKNVTKLLFCFVMFFQAKLLIIYYFNHECNSKSIFVTKSSQETNLSNTCLTSTVNLTQSKTFAKKRLIKYLAMRTLYLVQLYQKPNKVMLSLDVTITTFLVRIVDRKSRMRPAVKELSVFQCGIIPTVSTMITVIAGHLSTL